MPEPARAALFQPLVTVLGLRARWHADGGYREFLGIAFPLILSSASWSLQHFVDRIFLTWYSTEALAAGNPGGLTNFVILSLFLGIAQYVNTFVAQYVGARRYDRVGPAVWQGVYLSIACGLLALIPAAYSVQLFDFIGHDPAIRKAESDYFSVLCFGIGFHVLAAALSSFFTGRGESWTVMVVTVIGSLLNILLDYLLIFGNWGFPEWGIRGAAWATNLAGLFAAIVYFILFLRNAHRATFATLTGWRPDLNLLTRLFRYGGPSGLTFMLDILAFSIFILMAGRLGTVELAATNLATHINGLAFMPLMGAGIAVSTMVGQRLGRNQPEAAEYCTWTGFHVGLGYMTAMALAYVAVPEFFLSPFKSQASDAEFTAAYAIAIPLLRVVAIYCVFDAFYAIFTAGLKGAGDTSFIMWMSLALGWSMMVIPVVIGQTYFGFGLFTIWGLLCFYICTAAVVFYLRFRGGKWKLMRVIEESDLTLTVLDPQTPAADEQIDEVRSQLGAPTNAELFPPHFLKSTFPKIGGHTALFLRDGRTVGAGFLFPRASSTSRRAYTLRLHSADAELNTRALGQAALRVAQMKWADADLVLYQLQGNRSYAAPCSVPAPGLSMVRPDAGDAEAIRRMQGEIWSSEPDFLYPVDLHSDKFHAASSLIAKFDGAPIGFLFGFYSFKGPALPDGWGQPPGAGAPRLRIESQLLGVVPTFRGRNIGGALKAAQAEQARANGITVIHWTVDPLQYANARLNFGQLGAVAFTFYRNYYTFRNALNQTPASRLGITWLVDSTRVRQALQRLVNGDSQPSPGAGDQGFPGPGWRRIPFGQQPELDDGPPSLAVEIPAHWTALQKEDPELAGAWRASTDEVFERILGFEEGRYIITGVGTEKERKYLLAQRADNELLESLGGTDDVSETTP